jgi:transposase-like protein
MLIHLHKQATTTPKVRAAIQASDEPGTVLAESFGVTPQTVYKWRKRDSVEDRSHTPHRLQTTLTPAQEAVAVALRKALPISLDDLLAVVREFLNPDVSRSGLDPSPSGLNRWRHDGSTSSAWCGQPARPAGQGGAAEGQRVQGLRARIPARRCEVSTSNG